MTTGILLGFLDAAWCGQPNPLPTLLPSCILIPYSFAIIGFCRYCGGNYRMIHATMFMSYRVSNNNMFELFKCKVKEK
jgi:hypothetical protein